MLYTKNSFTSYQSLVFDNLDFDNFTPGWYGVQLSQLSTISGVGASAIALLASLLDIPADAEVLRYNLSPSMEVRQTIAASFVVFEGESGSDELTLSIGGIRFPYLTVVKTLKSKRYAIAPDVVTTVNGESPCFTIYPVKEDGLPLDSEKLSFEIIPSGENNDERTFNRKALNDFLKTKHVKDLASTGLVLKLNLESSDIVWAKLKELPIGEYECLNLKFEDQKTINKDGKDITIFAKWKLIAKNLSDGITYGVDAAPSTFIGQTVDNDARYLSQRFHLLVRGHKVVGKLPDGSPKVSVQGQMSVNVNTGRAIARAFFASPEYAQLRAAQVATVPAIEPEPLPF